MRNGLDIIKKRWIVRKNEKRRMKGERNRTGVEEQAAKNNIEARRRTTLSKKENRAERRRNQMVMQGYSTDERRKRQDYHARTGCQKQNRSKEEDDFKKERK